MFEIINLDRNATPEEELIAYKKFFKFLNVNLKNDKGEYKNLYDIFKEAHDNYIKTKVEEF